MTLPTSYFGTAAAGTSSIQIELVPGQRRLAGLLLPANPQPGLAAGITDGTSNTILVSELMSVDDCLRQPGPLKAGFGLLLPATERSALAAGQILPSTLLLPPGAPGSRVGAARAFGVRVAGIGALAAGITAWLVPQQGIIAVLIAL